MSSGMSPARSAADSRRSFPIAAPTARQSAVPRPWRNEGDLRVRAPRGRAIASWRVRSKRGAVVESAVLSAPTTGGNTAAIAAQTARWGAPRTGCQRARGTSFGASRTRPGNTCLPNVSRPRDSLNSATVCGHVKLAMQTARRWKTTRAPVAGEPPASARGATTPFRVGSHAFALDVASGAWKPSIGNVVKSAPRALAAKPYASAAGLDAGSIAAHAAGTPSTTDTWSVVCTQTGFGAGAQPARSRAAPPSPRLPPPADCVCPPPAGPAPSTLS